MIKEKIKSLVEQKTKGDTKKTIENLIVFLVLLVITIIAINLIWGDSKKDNTSQGQEEYRVLAEEINNSNIYENTTYNLEKELEKILSKISGVGKVQVLITYSETSQVVPMHNEIINISKTEEIDSERRNENHRNI